MYIYIYTPDQLKAEITLDVRSASFFGEVCDLKTCLLLAVDVIATVSWCCVITREWWFRVHFIHVEIPSISVVYSVRFPSVLSFLCVTAPKHSRQTSYIILQKDIICWWLGAKRKLLVLVCPSSYLITLGPLNSLLARNVSRTLKLNNGLLNTVGVFLIHKPIIRFAFSGRRITSFAQAYLVDS